MSQERLNGFAMCNMEKAILDTIDLSTVLMILHQEMPEEVSFVSQWIYGVQIYSNQINSRSTNKLLF